MQKCTERAIGYLVDFTYGTRLKQPAWFTPGEPIG